MNLAKSFMAWHDSLVESKSKFVWQGCVLGFGVSSGLLFSLALVNSDDIANHPLWDKILFVIGMTVIGGPMAGWVVWPGDVGSQARLVENKRTIDVAWKAN